MSVAVEKREFLERELAQRTKNVNTVFFMVPCSTNDQKWNQPMDIAWNIAHEAEIVKALTTLLNTHKAMKNETKAHSHKQSDWLANVEKKQTENE